MNHFVKILAVTLLGVALAAAQVVPGRYVVELSEAPLGAAVRAKGRAALVDRHQAILSEQARIKSAVETRRGKVVSSVDSLMNALIVKGPDVDPAALAAIPGVKKVYPVHLMKKSMDRALGLHRVPTAWTLAGGEDKAGAGIKIGILDTGISPDHPGFRDPSLRFPAGFPLASSARNLTFTSPKIIVARSYEDIYELDEPDDARDRDGHGTAVAMCAAGVRNNGPLATITGVAPKAWIGAYKVSPLNEGAAADDVILKAMDDALADGMDIINLSFGSLFQFETGPDFLPGVAFDRLKTFGVMAVVAAGNAGPGLNSLSDVANQASVLAVGSALNDRIFGDNVIADGVTYRAFAGTGPTPTSGLSGTVFDAQSVDPTGFLCSPLEEGAATGKIVLILRGVCTFEEKANHAKAGGAIAALMYTDAARPEGFSPAVGAATLPTALVSYGDGVAIKSAVAMKPNLLVAMPFKRVAFSSDPRALSPFSSKGPTSDFRIKPDLTATGSDIYTATQSVDAEGESYSKDGYLSISGTSFASPIVAGAAAVLRAARPGLTVDQYNSLLINGATPLFRNGGPILEPVQQTGSGLLNLEAALRNTVTVYPTSLTFGLGNGTMAGALSGHIDQFAITNIGKTADTFKIRSIPYDSAPPLQFADVPSALEPQDTFSLTLNPGQTKTLYSFWTARLPRGEYQGQILVEGTSTSVLTPYWYAAPSLIPREVLVLNPPGASARPGTALTVYVRIVDETGYPITTDASLRFAGTASTGAAIELLPGVPFSNVRALRFRLAPTARANTFSFSFGGLAPVTRTVNGVAP